MFSYEIPGGLQSNDCVEIRGIMSGNGIFIGLLSNEQKVPDEIPLKLSLELGGYWNMTTWNNGQESSREGTITNSIYMDLPFTIQIINLLHAFKIIVNNELLGLFDKPKQSYQLTNLTMDGDAEFHSVEFKDAANVEISSDETPDEVLLTEIKKKENSSPPSFIRVDESRVSQYGKHPKTIEAPLVELKVSNQSCLPENTNTIVDDLLITRNSSTSRSSSRSSSSSESSEENKSQSNSINLSVPKSGSDDLLILDIARRDKKLTSDLNNRNTINLGDIDTSHRLDVTNSEIDAAVKLKKYKHQKSPKSNENVHKHNWNLSKLFKKKSFSPSKQKPEDGLQGTFTIIDSKNDLKIGMQVPRQKKEKKKFHTLDNHLPKLGKHKSKSNKTITHDISLNEETYEEIKIEITEKEESVMEITTPFVELKFEDMVDNKNTKKEKNIKFGGKVKKPKGDVDIDINTPDVDADIHAKKPTRDIDLDLETPDVEIDIDGKKKKHGLDFDIHLPDWKLPKFGGKVKKPKGDVDIDINTPDVDVDIHGKKPTGDIDVDLETPDVEIDIDGKKKKHGLDFDIHLPDWKLPKFGGKVKKPKGDVDIDINTPDVDFHAKDLSGNNYSDHPLVPVVSASQFQDPNPSNILIRQFERDSAYLVVDSPHTSSSFFGKLFYSKKSLSPTISSVSNVNRSSDPHFDSDHSSKPSGFSFKNSFFPSKFFSNNRTDKVESSPNQSEDVIVPMNFNAQSYAPDFYPSVVQGSDSSSISDVDIHPQTPHIITVSPSALIKFRHPHSLPSNGSSSADESVPVVKRIELKKRKSSKKKFDWSFCTKRKSEEIEDHIDASNHVAVSAPIPLEDDTLFNANLLNIEIPDDNENSFVTVLPRPITKENPISFIGEHCLDNEQTNFSIFLEESHPENNNNAYNRFEIRYDNGSIVCCECYLGDWQSEVTTEITNFSTDKDFRVVLLPDDHQKIGVFFNGTLNVEYKLKNHIDVLMKVRLEGSIKFSEVKFFKE